MNPNQQTNNYKGAISLQSGSQFQRKTPLEMKLDRQSQTISNFSFFTNYNNVLIQLNGWAKTSKATKSKDEDFNTSYVLSKISRLRKFILKQSWNRIIKKKGGVGRWKEGEEGEKGEGERKPYG